MPHDQGDPEERLAAKDALIIDLEDANHELKIENSTLSLELSNFKAKLRKLHKHIADLFWI